MPSRRTRPSAVFLLLVISLSACVTINVYFPAAAAEQAADRIIQEVWGEIPLPSAAPPQGQHGGQGTTKWLAVVDLFIPTAHAQDLNVSSPAIDSIKRSLTARHRQLVKFYDNGALGLTATGDLALRDANAVPLAERGTLSKLVEQDNRDRAALYREISVANGHPEWEAQIRSTFAKQWIANAPSGWWFQNAGQWQRK